VLALLGGDEAGMKKIVGAMQHGSLVACESCHGAGMMVAGRTTAIYPCSADPDQLPRLTTEDYCAAVDARNVKDGLSLRQQDLVAKNLGWKFVSSLSMLPYFNVVDSCVEDFLHRLSLGVCAQLTAATFGYKDKAASNLQLPEPVAKLVSARVSILSAQLPQEVHSRLPSPLKSWPWYNGMAILLLDYLTCCDRCTVCAVNSDHVLLP
jgi:hypothetical protein